MLDLGDRTSVYQPEQTGLKFPRELNTNDPEVLRRHRKRHLVGACRAFARWGLDYGFAGHLTIRDPEHQERYWTNPMAITLPFPDPASAFPSPTAAPSLGSLHRSGSSVPHIHPSLPAPVSML